MRSIQSVALLVTIAVCAAVTNLAWAQPPAADLMRVFNDPVALDPPADKLIVLVHGAASSPAAWADNMADQLDNTFDALPEVWDVWAYDWNQDAMTDIPPDIRSRNSAKAHGQHLADLIVGGGYDYVHLIGHSLGGRVIQSATQVVAEAGGVDVHLTFLDAFTALTPGLQVIPVWPRIFGEGATFAEHYFSNEPLVLGTNTSFPNAFNVDITDLDLDVAGNRVTAVVACNIFGGNFDSVACGNANADNHQWPHEWYLRTITGPLPEDANLGHPQSREGGGAFLSIDPPVPPQFTGQLLTLLQNGDPTVSDVAAINKVLGPQLNPLASNPQPSAMDNTVVFDTDSIDLTATVGTPAWLTVTIDLTNLQGVNSLEFDFSFFAEGPQEGVLTVFTETEEAHQIWQQFALNQTQFSGEIILNTSLADQDMLDLSFRLDVTGMTGSFVHIDNIHPGTFTMVPEPSSLMLAALGGVLLVLVGRRRK